MLTLASAAIPRAAGQTSSTAPSDKPASTDQTAKPSDSTRLIVVKMVRPVYPERARKQQIQGEVVIRLAITPEGDVESATAVSGDALLTAAAIEAMKQWKFEPYIHNGQAVRVTTNQRYDFAFRPIDKAPDGEPTASLDASAVTPTPSAGTEGAPSADASTKGSPQRVRLLQGASKGNLMHAVQPVYPADARNHFIEGTVVLDAVIGTDGRIKNLTLVSGNKELAEAAIAAVQQWRYKPFTLKGTPVEVETPINVNFTLAR